MAKARPNYGNLYEVIEEVCLGSKKASPSVISKIIALGRPSISGTAKWEVMMCEWMALLQHLQAVVEIDSPEGFCRIR